MNTAIAFTYWILSWQGYMGIDGKKFETEEACRQYALTVLEKRPFPWPYYIHCEEITSTIQKDNTK